MWRQQGSIRPASPPALFQGAEYVVEAPLERAEAVEAVYSGDFPGKEALIHFYTEVGAGSFPDGACIPSAEGEGEEAPEYGMEVERFCSLGEISGYLAEYQEFGDFETYCAGYIPIASDGCGNDFFVSTRTGEVFYLDHEYGFEEGIFKVAGSFAEFLYSIHPLEVGVAD